MHQTNTTTTTSIDKREEALTAVIQGIGTACPPDILAQSDATHFAEAMFGDAIEDLERLLPIFHNTQIERRAIAQPLDWYGRPHSFVEANALYQEVGANIAERAAAQAIERSGLATDAIGALLFVSSTGIATPSLDAALIQRLGLSPQTKRIPLWGLGCAGGVSGLARAAEIALTMPNKAVLLVAMELCSLTFQQGDMSKANLVAVSLFGDGAAALVLQAQTPEAAAGKAQVLDSHSTLFPETEYVMGWDLVDTGLQVRFDRSIPALVLDHLATLVVQASESWGYEAEALQHYVVHPGGARVLDAYAASLKIDPARLQHAHHVLAQQGNMSSPTVFFVLEHYLQEVPSTGQEGLMLAWGPGFSAEQLLFRW